MIPQLISDQQKSKDTTPSKEEKLRKINTTALDAIKAYTSVGWAWSDTQTSQSLQTQTPAQSTRRTRHASQGLEQEKNLKLIPAKHNSITIPHHNLQRGRRGGIPRSLKIPPHHCLFLSCNQVRLRQPQYGIIKIITWLFLAMSRPVTQFSSVTQIQEVLNWPQTSNINLIPTQLHRHNMN